VGGGIKYMMHHSKTQWQLFVNRDLDEALQEKMQEHLLECDDCMTIYTDLIEISSDNEVSIPEDFTDSIMNQIFSENRQLSQRKLKQKRINLFIYYVSAASITLFLTTTGVFQNLYEGFSAGAKYAEANAQKQSIFISGWTHKLTDETSKLVNIANNK
jgi:hypothetical protein